MNPPRIVFSTDHGRMCPDCSQPVATCQCNQTSGTAPAGDGVVRVRRETKGRRGKTVTTVSGIPLAADELRALAKQLKQRCGSGGTATNGVVEIQGDHVAKLIEDLTARGYEVRRAGG